MSLSSVRNTRDVGRTREKVENHEPKASDFRLFSSVLPTSQVFLTEDRDMENECYCFYKIL